jgi:catechol 2,3-dioxygenase-like lactoylglutathione lyase family enzyme
MKFKMSPNVAVRTGRFSEATEFYERVLGFANRSSDPAPGNLDAAPLNLFVIEDDQVKGPVMELFVEDLEAARDHLVAAGCEVIRWRGEGQDCYVRDPFGVKFNLWKISESEQTG